MKMFLSLLFLLISYNMASAQNTIYITANGETRTVTLADNTATLKLKELLAAGNIQVDMHDYGGWEKIGDQPQSLPTSDAPITAQPGDIMLYLGNQMVVFYGNNNWNYTRLGKIDDIINLNGWLGNRKQTNPDADQHCRE